MAYKKAVGNEGDTSITVTTGTVEQSVSVVWVVRGVADPDVSPPEVSSGVTGLSTNPNPDSLTPTGGTKDYMWIAVEGNNRISQNQGHTTRDATFGT